MRFPSFASQILLVTALMSCGHEAHAQWQVEDAFPALSFSRPVDLQHAGDGSSRLFVVEQPGRIRVFRNERSANEAPVFLDISSRVDDSGNEEGLLGLAFHPAFASNGFFFVNYTASDPARTVVARYSVSSTNPDVADPSSETVLLTIAQPFSNHNGGQLQFGPDGMLYIAVGDGGSGGDPQGNGQNRQTLLGSILRLDVDNPSSGREYGIPPDNPFVGNAEGYREEVYAWGLRNPWRMSFDSSTGALWVADVGQNAFEEISVVESGGNYGWNIMEGFSCYSASNCDQTGLTLPVFDYAHVNGNNSITGGYVYRGTLRPSLFGRYIYADYVSGRIWALSEDQGSYSTELLVDTSFGISSFGQDENNELYICGFDGRIHRLQSTGTKTEKPPGPTGARIGPVYPNPFSRQVRIPIELARASHVDVAVHDVLGRRVAGLIHRSLPVGEHTVVWSGLNDGGTRVTPGVYWISVTSHRGTSALAVIYRPS